MRRVATTIVMVTTVLLIHLGIHGYIWLRLVSDPPGAGAGESFDLAGVDDPTGRGFPGHGPDLYG